MEAFLQQLVTERGGCWSLSAKQLHQAEKSTVLMSLYTVCGMELARVLSLGMHGPSSKQNKL